LRTELPGAHEIYCVYGFALAIVTPDSVRQFTLKISGMFIAPATNNKTEIYAVAGKSDDRDVVMDKLKKNKNQIRNLFAASLFSTLVACGGGSGDSDPLPPKPLSDDTVLATGNVDYEAGEVAGGGDYIEAQWLHMQTCLKLSAQEPSVSVVEGKIQTVDASDDVVRHIDGQVQASVHINDTSAAIQVRSADFDGSLGKQGSYLRSIMGRYLWLTSNMPERDYPYDCADGAE